MVDLVIIGGGASGLMAAAIAAPSGKKTVLLEKKDECGRKMLLTGKGRCNITNSRPWEDFQEHIHPDPSFFKNAFFEFSNTDIVEFLNGAGLQTVEERGMRIFPVTQKSVDVRNTFLNYLSRYPNLTIRYSSEVVSVQKTEKGIFKIEGIQQTAVLSHFIYEASAVIIATGGLSYPVTGSTGDGYRFAERFGHKIIPTHPSLTALMPKFYDSRLIGLTLKNVSLSLEVDGNVVQNEFGELTFTNGGIEGALGFRVSRKAVKALNSGQKVRLIIDLKPALSVDQLKKRVEKDYKAGMTLNMFLNSYLPLQLISPFISMSDNLNIQNLPVRLKNWTVDIKSYVGYERCVVTAGGVDIKEISRKTMESKKVKGLFFSGEVMNLDADTGGYNLQIAFSTGALAAKSAVKYLESVNN